MAVCGNIIIIKEDYEFLNPCTRSHSVTTRLRAMQEKIAERAKLWYKKDNKSGKEVFPMPEMLDIVDENGVPTGQSVPRTTAHAEGLRHRTSHVWIVRRKNGRVQVLLQMRCAAKDSYPGCYDISSAGHIPAGAEFVGSALRELREELGVSAAPADLHECGLRRFRFEAEFHGKAFKDNQVSKVFCLWLDREAEDFAVQKSEIDYVKWFDLDEAVAAVEQGTIPNCIFPEELGMVKKFVGQTGGGCCR